MPAAPAAPPPATPAPSRQVDSGSAVPVSRGEIHVTADGMTATPPGIDRHPETPSADIPKPAPEKPGKPAKTARQEMIEKLNKRAGIEPAPEEKPSEVKPPAETTDKTGEDAETPATETPDPAATKDKTEPNKKGKVSSWKLLDEHKERNRKLEQEIVELRKLIPNEESRKQELSELETTRNRVKELEDEIRFVNYAKSPEFKEKYEAPYQKAWANAMSELSELSVPGPDGNPRAVGAGDLLELVNLPLGKAREVAVEKFGDFANDAMAHRKEIKRLFEAQATALDEARTKGDEREKAKQSELQTKTQTLQKQTAELWQKHHESILKDEKLSKFFAPIEGDEEGNKRLAAGFELVDQAFKENPMDPRLTPEQREQAVKRHVALRNRAAAFGRDRYLIEMKDQKIAELEKQLSEFKESTPTTTGSTSSNAAATPVSAREEMLNRLGKLVRPR